MIFQKTNLLRISLFIFLPLFLWNQERQDPFSDIRNEIEISQGVEKELLLENLAWQASISGDLDVAASAIYELWVERDKKDWHLLLSYYQLHYEMGHWEILSTISPYAVNPTNPRRRDFLVLEIRLLMSMGFWEEAGNLVEANQDWRQHHLALSYISWYYYSIRGEKEKAFELKNKILQDFPNSAESMILRGVAQESVRPSLLLMELRPEIEQFYYQIGAFQNREKAESEAQLLGEKGFRTEILHEGLWYKLLIPINQPQAEQLLSDLTQQGYQPFRVAF